MPHLFYLLFQCWGHLIGGSNKKLKEIKIYQEEKKTDAQESQIPQIQAANDHEKGLYPHSGARPGVTTKSQAICKKSEEKKQYDSLEILFHRIGAITQKATS